MLKRLIAVLLAAIMVLSMAACNVNVTPAATDAAPADAEEEAEAEEPAADGEETAEVPEVESKYEKNLTISMSILDAEKTDISAKDKWFDEKFNITWNFIPVTWGDWLEKVRAWVNADDMPNIVWWDMKVNHTAEYKKWAAAGAFREIPNDPERWPNIAAVRDTMVTDEALLTVDGKLYGLGASRNNPEFLNNCYYSMFAYRRDWAKAVGMYKEGDIYTWDEVKAMIDAVKEQDPGGNGAGNTIGITSESWAWPGDFMQAVGTQAERKSYQLDENGNYYLYAKTDMYVQELEFVTDLFQNGYIWKDQINDSGSDGYNKFLAGQSFMFLGNNSPGWFNGDIYTKMVQGGVTKEYDGVAPMIVLSPADNETFYLGQTEDYWSVASISHNTDDETFERILDMWDWLASEEGRIFKVAGIPGVDYKDNGDGTYEILWEKNDDGEYISPYTDVATRQYTMPCLTPSPNETTRAFGYDLFEGVYDFMANSGHFKAQLIPWEVVGSGGEQYSTYGSFDDEVKTHATQIIVNGGDVAAQWHEFIDSIADKIKLVEDELNATLK